MKKQYAYITTVLLMLFLGSCSQHPRNHEAGFTDQSRLDSITRVLINYNAEGKYDSLVLVARDFLDESQSRNDSIPVIYSGIYIAQAYLFMENADSTRHYLDLISSYRSGREPAGLEVTINNVLGINAMKSELNYSKALEYFQEGYEWAKKEEHPKNVNHQLTMLMNIVNIFYIRSDKHGMDYAKEAYDLSMAENVNDYYKCLINISMAQMSYLSGDLNEAYGYIREADRLVKLYNYYSLTAIISLLYADIYNTWGDHSQAEKYYSLALESSSYTDPGTVSLIYLNYGKFCEDRRQYEKAISLYKRGLEISSLHVEFRRNLLRRLSDLYYLTADREVSLEYYREYRAHLDSVENTSREQEFNNQLLSYQQIKHDHEIQSRELELLKANRKIVIAVAILLILAIITGSLILLYDRQRRMYRTLVTQHQSFMQRLNRGSLAENIADNDEDVQEKTGAGRELFLKVEELMREGKFYRQKDISLEKVAEHLKSNKTYISQAINKFVGISFNSYINMYRIGEATNLISNPDSDIPLKQLADDLGYNSVSVFYKAFQRETGCTPGRYRKEIEEAQN